MLIGGKVHRFKDNVNTDEIIPAKYLNTTDPKVLGVHCMEGIDAKFPQQVKPGDVILAGKNFGCGSSREHAAVALKSCGVAIVIAESFARIFYRNAINTGLPIMVMKYTDTIANVADEVCIDLAQGTVINSTTGQKFQGEPFPEFMQTIIQSGGLIGYVKRKLKKNS